MTTEMNEQLKKFEELKDSMIESLSEDDKRIYLMGYVDGVSALTVGFHQRAKKLTIKQAEKLNIEVPEDFKNN